MVIKNIGNCAREGISSLRHMRNEMENNSASGTKQEMA